MVEATLTPRPQVSVVTPFYNAALYLTECIESVLGQKFTEFEYILLDNCSTDGSTEIAESYARRDPRIRFIRQSQFVSQLKNYNRALEEICQVSEYCKIVEADNYIFPDCLQLMIQAFGQSETIGLVSSYTLFGNELLGSGYPYPMTMVPGREWARRYLRGASFVFGSPTTVMYRSTVVRHDQPFYDEALLHADTEKCMEILEHWDFGFVHQVLSYLRTDNESISSAKRRFQPVALDRYIITQRYAPAFLEANEAKDIRAKSRREYYRVLANEVILLRGPAFWRYHEIGLKTLKETLNWSYLALQTVLTLLWMASNPGRTTVRVLRFCKRRMKAKARSE
jgi:glycosyltransferase involved in cell wall biosynthesis